MHLTSLALVFLLGGTLWMGTDVNGQENSRGQIESWSANSADHATTTGDDAKGEKDLSASETADRKTHFHLGTVTASVGYGRGYYGPYSFYPYGPFYYESFGFPFWGPYYGFPSFAYDAGKGEIKLTADPPDAAVYVDGAYAGTANHLKNIWLDPGAYNLSVSAGGRETFQQRVYILSGKTLKLSAKLESEKGQP